MYLADFAEVEDTRVVKVWRRARKEIWKESRGPVGTRVPGPRSAAGWVPGRRERQERRAALSFVGDVSTRPGIGPGRRLGSSIAAYDA